MTKTYAEIVAGMSATQIEAKISAMDKAHKRGMKHLRALYRLQVTHEAQQPAKEPGDGDGEMKEQ